MKREEKLSKKIMRALEFNEILDERDALEMRGSSELTVREVIRFLHYSDNEIKLSLREYILRIAGEELYCSSYLGGVVRVSGNIMFLEIEKKGRGDKNA